MCAYSLFMINLEERFYTSTEVADILGVSLRSIYRYLEEDKITAEVKTATGRHRFTKQNIIDFLYPNPQEPKVNEAVQQTQPAVASTQPQAPTVTVQVTEVPQASQVTAHVEPMEQPLEEVANVETDTEVVTPNMPTEEAPSLETAPEVAETSTVETVPVTDSPVEEQPVEETTSDDPVDWLSKFKQAAEKYKQEQEAAAPIQETAQPQTSSPAEPVAQAPTTPVAPAAPVEVVTEEPKQETPSASEMYYRSSVGGLKDIAQAVDKSAKKSSVPYAFTMNAGLSLHKPIKPFSLLHVYVRPQDREFFEKSLELATSGKESAQLCLKFTDDGNVFSNVDEMHGLSVVATERLKKDLVDAGEADLASEL